MQLTAAVKGAGAKKAPAHTLQCPFRSRTPGSHGPDPCVRTPTPESLRQVGTIPTRDVGFTRLARRELADDHLKRTVESQDREGHQHQRRQQQHVPMRELAGPLEAIWRSAAHVLSRRGVLPKNRSRGSCAEGRLGRQELVHSPALQRSQRQERRGHYGVRPRKTRTRQHEGNLRGT
jgi:hypothetical protein